MLKQADFTTPLRLMELHSSSQCDMAHALIERPAVGPANTEADAYHTLVGAASIYATIRPHAGLQTFGQYLSRLVRAELEPGDSGIRRHLQNAACHLLAQQSRFVTLPKGDGPDEWGDVLLWLEQFHQPGYGGRYLWFTDSFNHAYFRATRGPVAAFDLWVVEQLQALGGNLRNLASWAEPDGWMRDLSDLPTRPETATDVEGGAA